MRYSISSPARIRTGIAVRIENRNHDGVSRSRFAASAKKPNAWASGACTSVSRCMRINSRGAVAAADHIDR
jgi:hypothetical protein